MTKIPSRLLMTIAIFCAAFMLRTAYAEQAQMPVTEQTRLAVLLPDVDHELLEEQLVKLRSQLIQRKQELVQIVEDEKLDGGDAIITVIMPGGLLYAGYKKARYEQARDELARVSAAIEEYSGDLLAMQSWSVPVAIARLP